MRGIASGAMGAVYEVLHIETERRRALKVMHPHLADNPEFHARFKLEARVAARIESDHIVEVFDAGIDAESGRPFLVMELLRGEELSGRLRRTGRLPPEEAVAYLRQTAIALDKTHAAGVVHRDLKPANLFLAETEDDGAPRIKVLDFGIAKLVVETATDSAATAVLGTPLYMAPEQFSGEPVSRAADIFALGMIAYTLLVGKAYWLNDRRKYDNPLAFAAIAAYGPHEPASARADAEGVKLPPAFDAWFARVTARAPEARFATASAAIEALAEVFDLPTPPVRSSRLLPAETPSGRASLSPRSSPLPSGVQFSTTDAAAAPPATKQRSRSAIAIAALVLLGGVGTFASLNHGALPARGSAGPAQAAGDARSPASAPPLADPTPALPGAPATARAPDIVTPAPAASAPLDKASRALVPAAGAASAPPPPARGARRRLAPAPSAAEPSRESLYKPD
ncbi:serine/threonine-protein kinase [Sorangium cellulosum]|uniref:serine/threonine-protein kinase n=1 Tax=Sorangium cellulosum TaxID=56 RepID=UPI001F2CB084|nr:serine/threonine-protein kinase [Sorangium cellulosum]